MLRIGVSASLLGRKCNFDGSDSYQDFIANLEDIDDIELFPYCPEFMQFGAPRPQMSIDGGDGQDVLDGKAKVIDSNGEDVTASIIYAAEQFIEYLKENDVAAVILADELSVADGANRKIGVNTAMIKKQGIPILLNTDEDAITSFVNQHLPGQL